MVCPKITGLPTRSKTMKLNKLKKRVILHQLTILFNPLKISEQTLRHRNKRKACTS